MASEVHLSGGGEQEAITLILESGETFENIPVPDDQLPLKDFLDTALKQLEVSEWRRRIS